MYTCSGTVTSSDKSIYKSSSRKWFYLGSSITNYSALSRNEGLVLHTTVGIGYEVPWRQVEAMLLQAATRTPGLKAEPADATASD